MCFPALPPHPVWLGLSKCPPENVRVSGQRTLAATKVQEFLTALATRLTVNSYSVVIVNSAATFRPTSWLISRILLFIAVVRQRNDGVRVLGYCVSVDYVAHYSQLTDLTASYNNDRHEPAHKNTRRNFVHSLPACR
jgi:hypothetical protein